MAKIYNKNWNGVKPGGSNINTEELVDDFVLESPIDNTTALSDLEFVFEGIIDNNITSINSNNKPVYINGGPRNPKPIDQNKSVSVFTEEPATISTVDITKAISKVSNMIRDSLKNNADVYTLVYHGNIQANDFYIKLGNSIWQSLLELFNITRAEAQNPNYVFKSNGTQKYIKTLQFLDRIYHDTRVSLVKDPIDAINNYNEVFNEAGGITSEWLHYLEERIESKMEFLNKEDIQIILNTIIAFSWCYKDDADANRISFRISFDESCGCNDNDCCCNDTCNCAKDDNDNEYYTEDEDDYDEYDDEDDYDEDDDEDDYCCRPSDNYDDSDDEDECDIDEDDEDDDDVDAMSEVLCVEFNHDENVDDTIVSITTWNGLTSTLYADLKNIDVSSINGRPLDWLKHFIPNAVIITEETELFTSLNNDIDEMKFIKLADVCDVTDQKNDTSAIIGIYNIDEDLINMTDEELQRLSILVESSMNASPVFSHLQRTLEMEQLIIDEDTIIEYLSDIIDILDDEDSDEDEDDEEVVENIHQSNDVEFSSDTDILDYAASLVANENKLHQASIIDEEIYDDEDDYDEDDEDYDVDPDEDEDNVTIGEYLNNKNINIEEVVFTPIRKNKASKYDDIQ